MDAMDRGQVSRSAAEVYEELFVPALFGAWAPRVADAAAIREGDAVLDVACGTGVLAREAARRVGPRGAVTGLDCNDAMLAVARRVAPEIAWRQGRAEALPFADRAFDAVVCQFGLMFFDDRRSALAEMARVARPGGRLAIAVWDALEESPGYLAMVALLDRLFGARVAAALRAPFALGDVGALGRLLDDAGLTGWTIDTIAADVRYPSLDSWIFLDVKGWTLDAALDDEAYARLRREASRELARFVQPDGAVVFPAPAHIVRARRAASA